MGVTNHPKSDRNKCKCMGSCCYLDHPSQTFCMCAMEGNESVIFKGTAPHEWCIRCTRWVDRYRWPAYRGGSYRYANTKHGGRLDEPS